METTKTQHVSTGGKKEREPKTYERGPAVEDPKRRDEPDEYEVNSDETPTYDNLH